MAVMESARAGNADAVSLKADGLAAQYNEPTGNIQWWRP